MIETSHTGNSIQAVLLRCTGGDKPFWLLPSSEYESGSDRAVAETPVDPSKETTHTNK